MKRKLISLAVVAICLAIVTSGTLAFFVAEERTHNVLTTGGISIQLNEKMLENGVLVDFPKEAIDGILPGNVVSKIVSVENTGSDEAWIRIQIEQNIVGMDNKSLPLTLNDGSQVLEFGVDIDKWTYAEGWYYFNRPVVAGASTAFLFKEVQFAPEMGNEYQGCTANITVIAQAVQTANNGEAVMEAQGWPEEVDD